ncbi:YbhB/YbcL family Raf kinase inhibitor-like protein [Methylobacillus methanolivorans]
MKNLWIWGLGVMIVSSHVALADQVKADLTYNSIQARTDTVLEVKSATFKHGESIPLENSSYGDSLSPALSWSVGPAGTKSYAILLEDEDGIKDGKPIVHWVVYNIPGTVTSLPADLPKDGKLIKPDGVLQGVTISGRTGYLGPRPRPLTGTHHYYFQVYALDNILAVPEGVSREQFVEALRGKVLAKGKLEGVYESPRD